MREQIKISDLGDKLSDFILKTIEENNLPRIFGEKLLYCIRDMINGLYGEMSKSEDIVEPPYYIAIEDKPNGSYEVIILTEGGGEMSKGELDYEKVPFSQVVELVERVMTDDDLLKDIYSKLTIKEKESVRRNMVKYKETLEHDYLADIYGVFSDKLDVSELTDLLK